MAVDSNPNLAFSALHTEDCVYLSFSNLVCICIVFVNCICVYFHMSIYIVFVCTVFAIVVGCRLTVQQVLVCVLLFVFVFLCTVFVFVLCL